MCVEPYRSDHADAETVRRMLESLHLSLLRPWWARLLTGQPSLRARGPLQRSRRPSPEGGSPSASPRAREASVEAILRAAYPNCRLRALEAPFDPPRRWWAAQAPPVHPQGEDARALRAAPRAAGGSPADVMGSCHGTSSGAARSHPRPGCIPGARAPAARRTPGPRPGPAERRRERADAGRRRRAARGHGPRARAPVPARAEGRL